MTSRSLSRWVRLEKRAALARRVRSWLPAWHCGTCPHTSLTFTGARRHMRRRHPRGARP